MTRQVAVTGVGVVAPGAIGSDAFVELLGSGRTATRAITLFDPTGFRSRMAAECDFDPAEHGLSAHEAQRMDRYVQFAAVAAREALDAAGLDMAAEDPWRTGVSLGSAVGGTTLLESDYIRASARGSSWEVDHERTSPALHRVFSPAPLAGEIAELSGAQGVVHTVSTGCTSGLDAVGYAFQAIAEGRADVMITGASESPVSPITVSCFDAIRATSERNDAPESASRPFDRDRDGFVLGEGAAVLVLEELEHARRRGAEVHCLVGGFATRSNAYHMTGLTREGIELAESIERAMRQADRGPDAIDYINAHGSGTKQNDRHETASFKLALGGRAREVPISSIKSMVGHSLGAIGAIELAACVLAMDESLVPPTANLENADPECDLDYVPVTARQARLDTVLSVGSGFGGFQSAVVLDRRGLR
ncbi:beta-ketoacyl-[acyl-carrier-protein] synthase family protein [Streptomyces kanamyceticus]|uniref:Beta-ketoacyl-[acyl-carrier-protein] synthase family protein n=1 Tax=Streptomyces kanamyceticus TaxID=1967 RepID=A0A5J6GBV5_STRKN|nr:beta-ketoacyl-[acyl-carrier-protein] synthase family protein [Streptomyces kanamyceticus]QEU90746.1 beta-ketoacyl-[acyl-carrier-protein] synthase family protein [Streptomyces kanamyceticus]